MTNETEHVPGELSPSEKRTTFENDRKVREQTGTFFSHTHDDDLGGRFAKQTPQTVVGLAPVPDYPQGPAWSADPTGVEPPLNYSVNELQPTGEAHEVARSIANLNPSSDPAPSLSSPAQATDGPANAPPGDGGSLSSRVVSERAEPSLSSKDES